MLPSDCLTTLWGQLLLPSGHLASFWSCCCGPFLLCQISSSDILSKWLKLAWLKVTQQFLIGRKMTFYFFIFSCICPKDGCIWPVEILVHLCNRSSDCQSEHFFLSYWNNFKRLWQIHLALFLNFFPHRWSHHNRRNKQLFFKMEMDLSLHWTAMYHDNCSHLFHQAPKLSLQLQLFKLKSQLCQIKHPIQAKIKFSLSPLKSYPTSMCHIFRFWWSY